VGRALKGRRDDIVLVVRTIGSTNALAALRRRSADQHAAA
jgi:hypothetical protein